MKILAVDTSAGPASCAVIETEAHKGVFSYQVLASAVTNTRLTHSQTLMPMVQDMLVNAALTMEQIDLLAAASGPGSFTGVRIGIGAVKGLGFPDMPCGSVSTLSAMAYNLAGLPFSGIICAAMDARRNQIYTAFFEINNGQIRRLTDDMAIPAEQAGQQLTAYGQPVVLVGDGAPACHALWQDKLPQLQVTLAPPHLIYQHAVGVAAVAAGLVAQSTAGAADIVQLDQRDGQLLTAEQLLPRYLRRPQAERERLGEP